MSLLRLRHRAVAAVVLPLLFILTVPFGRAAETVLSSLGSPAVSGTAPLAGLLNAPDGSFYGTASAGGANSNGTVFQLTSDGILTVLHAFNGGDGAVPRAALALGSDGNFYGTTSLGGSNGDGTVYQLTPSGTFTSLHSFSSGDGAVPYAALAAGADGNLYGTTTAGGANGQGTVFVMTPAGAVTTLYSFAGADGSAPYSGLTLAGDGFFYGTTYAGGASGHGSVFRIGTDGTLTTLHSFSGAADGGNPTADLQLGADGNLYGTTQSTVFELTTAGTLSTLYAFSASVLGTGLNGLVAGSDGYEYGMASGGGGAGLGEIFRLKLPDTYVAVHPFAGSSDGANPQGTLVPGDDGNFYGVTSNGGLAGGGTIFRLDGPPATPNGVSASAGTPNQVSLQWSAAARATAYNVYIGTAPGAEGALPLLSGITGTSTTVPSLSGEATYYFRVSATNQSSESLPSSEVSATPTGVPNAPRIISYTTGVAQIGLVWTAVPGASSYSVFSGNAAGAENLLQSGVSGTSYTASGLGCARTYFYVESVNTDGAGARSNEVSALPQPSVPAAPAAITGQPIATKGQVKLSWSASACANRYYVYQGTSPGAEVATPVKAVGVTSATIGQLTPGTTYYFKVSAADHTGTGAQSVEANVAPYGPPPAPTNLLAVQGSRLVTLSWTAAPGATRYAVYMSTTPGGEASTPSKLSSGTPVKLSGLSAATTYYFKVSATNRYGTGPATAEVSATTP